MKICIIGAGIIGADHANALRLIENASLAAVADISAEKAADFAGKYNVSYYTDYKRMIACEIPDAAIICLPHALHKEAAVFCAEHHVHVLLEKPMAVSVAECKEITKAAGENRVKLMIGHVMHYLQENIILKRLVESGEMGRLVAISDTRNTNYFSPGRPAWFLEKKTAGGGILMNLGAHCIDRILWISGSAVQDVFGDVGYDSRYGVEGNAQVLLKLQNGVTAAITCIGYQTPACNEIVLYFTEGAAKAENGVVSLSKEGGPYISADGLVNESDPFALQLIDFIGSIQQDSPVAISGEYGTDVIRVIEKVYGGTR